MSDEARAGRPEAAEVVWKWRAEDADAEKRERIASLRKGAALRFVVAAIAGGAFFWFSRYFVAYAVWSLGGLTLLLALASPLGAYSAIERAMRMLGHWVGRALTWILLAPVFYLFFAPFGLLFRRGARDPMKRRFDPTLASYWKKRERDPSNLDRPY